MANPQDQQQRDRALEQRSFIVQAPAGSGKTGLLTQKLLRCLAVVNDPEEVVAITFTRKAAAEMRERVVAALEAGLGPEPDDAYEQRNWALAQPVLERDREAGWGILDTPSRLRIQTFDSLCADIAARSPLTSEFGATPSVTDDAWPLYLEAARATLESYEDDGPWADDIVALLKHRDNRWNAAQELLASMLAKRDHWLPGLAGDDSYLRSREGLEEALRNIVDSQLAQICAAIPDEIIATIPSILRFAADNVDDSNTIAAGRDISDMPVATADHLDTWKAAVELLLTKEGKWRSSRGINKTIGFPPAAQIKDPAEKKSVAGIKQNLVDLIDAHKADSELATRLHAIRSLPSPSYSDSDWAILKALFNVLVVASAQLKVVFQAHNKVDFTEVAMAANSGLGDMDAPSELTLALDYQISHILVDEFQDTSMGQAELLVKLTSGWSPEDGRTLFMVGDPMQSIYRFRQAKVGIFLNAWKGKLGSIDLEPLRLTVNFRSEAGVIEWVNETFPKVLAAEPDEITSAVPYAASEAFRPAGNKPAVQVYPFIERNDALEAEQVMEILKDPAFDGDSTAILVRNRGHLLTIIERLKEEGIPFQAIEIDALGTQPIIVDLLAMTKAMLHPGDRISWLALLRAPYIGLTKADLLSLAGDAKDVPLIDLLTDEARVSHLSDDGRERLARVTPLLVATLAKRDQNNLRHWIEGLWIAIGGPACATPIDLDNAATYFELLDKLEREGEDLDPDKLQRKVDALYAAPGPSEGNPVQLMTIHKAKGLEFDRVIIPGLGRPPRADESALIEYLDVPGDRASASPSNHASASLSNHGPRFLMAPINSEMNRNGSNPIKEFIRRINSLAGHHEDGRLAYVAATRAKQQLHLLGHARLYGEDNLKPESGSLLASLWPALEEQFRSINPVTGDIGQQKEQEYLDGSIAVNPPPARLRLTGAWQCPAPEPAIVQTEVADQDIGDMVVYDWAGDTAKQTGTVVHRILEMIGKGEMDAQAALDSASIIKTLLRQEGVMRADLDGATERVLSAVQSTLESERGRWILDNTHEGSSFELPLSAIVGGRCINVVIDRTFVDNGTRWIIDYKSSTHQGSGLDAFLEEEVVRYGKKMRLYAEIMSRIDSRPIRLALYYPMMDAWVEIGSESVDPSVAAA